MPASKKKKGRASPSPRISHAWGAEPAPDFPLLSGTPSEPASSLPKHLRSVPSSSTESSPGLRPVEEDASPELDLFVEEEAKKKDIDIDPDLMWDPDPEPEPMKELEQDTKAKPELESDEAVSSRASPQKATEVSPKKSETKDDSEEDFWAPPKEKTKKKKKKDLTPAEEPDLNVEPKADKHNERSLIDHQDDPPPAKTSKAPQPAPPSPGHDTPLETSPEQHAAPSQVRLPSVGDPPPPHMPQHHFRQDHTDAFGLAQEDSTTPGSGKYFCGFDVLESPDSEASSHIDVLVIGSEGSLDVCRISRHRKELIGRLEGLRGSVIGAKILPCAERDDAFKDKRPLIACIVHGPIEDKASKTTSDSPSKPKSAAPRVFSNVFQTTVDVYSLKTSELISTIFWSPLVTARFPLNHPRFRPPPPVGDLSVTAQGGYAVVSSGESGEVYIFETTSSEQSPNISCIGKCWTTVKTVTRMSEGRADSSIIEDETRIPIVALSGRWLAIVPPLLSSSQKSLDGNAALSSTLRDPPGVSAYVSPSPPAADCETDGPKGASLINRVTKQATQEIRKGAQWIGEQSWNAMKSYWNKPNGTEDDGKPSMRRRVSDDFKNTFPPTHARPQETAAQTVHPALVAILDLKKLSPSHDAQYKAPLLPLATFTLDDGAAFLSFSPNGLALLSTNQLGDASQIWDLMRVTDNRAPLTMTNGKSGSIQNPTGLVRRLAIFPRMSPSTVVDVLWTTRADRVGIVTDKGTIHLHQLPRYEFGMTRISSPKVVPQQRSGLPSPGTSPQDLPAGGWIEGVRAGWQNVNGRLVSVRPKSESDGFASAALQTLGSASSAARYAGGRAVRNGFNAAVEGAHNFRHADENKIRLRNIKGIAKPQCFAWLTGKDQGLIATVSDGSVSIFAVKINIYAQGKKTTVLLDASKKAAPDHTLSPMTVGPLSPAVLGSIDASGSSGACAKEGVHGFWIQDRGNNARPRSAVMTKGPGASLNHDKDTSPPFEPLHRYKQIDLLTFTDDSKKTQQALGLVSKGTQWVFGLEMPQRKQINTRQNARSKQTSRSPDRGIEAIVGHMEDLEVDSAVVDDSHSTIRRTSYGKED